MYVLMLPFCPIVSKNGCTLDCSLVRLKCTVTLILFYNTVNGYSKHTHARARTQYAYSEDP